VGESPIDAGNFQMPRLSPDGRFLAIMDDRTLQIWIYDLLRGGRTALTSDPAVMPVWSPVGDEILFTRYILAEPRLYRKAVFRAELSPSTSRDVWAQPEAGEPVLIAGTPASELAPMFSPDGRFLAYDSDESGRYEVYVVPYPPTGERWAVSTGGGEEPVWSRDGRELFYRHGDQMLVVGVSTRPSFAASSPRVLFEGRFELTTGGHTQNYDVSPDGQKFLMIQRIDSTRLYEIRVVVGFDRELERLVPVP